MHLLAERLRSFRKRKKLENVVRHRFKPKNSYKTMPGKQRLLLYTLSSLLTLLLRILNHKVANLTILF